MNAAVAVMALVKGGFDISEQAIWQGAANVTWRARFQRIGNRLVIDGAHNPAAAVTVVATWKEVFGSDKGTVIFGAVESKDVNGVLALLGEIAGRWVFTRVNSVRTLVPADLAELVSGDVTIVENAAAALAEVKPDARVLVCGSLFLAGEVLSLVEGGDFETSAQ
jgi:dihydrofolate synthase/folylpolyglutamate synthase